MTLWLKFEHGLRIGVDSAAFCVPYIRGDPVHVSVSGHLTAPSPGSRPAADGAASASASAAPDQRQVSASARRRASFAGSLGVTADAALVAAGGHERHAGAVEDDFYQEVPIEMEWGATFRAGDGIFTRKGGVELPESWTLSAW